MIRVLPEIRTECWERLRKGDCLGEAVMRESQLYGYQLTVSVGCLEGR